MAKYSFEISDSKSETRDGKPIFPDVVDLTLYQKDAWRLVKHLLAQLEDGETWVFATLHGAVEDESDE